MARALGCVFCDIVAADGPARVVARGHGVTVFLPDEPATRGHVLVVPDDHVRDIWALTQGAARNLSSEVIRVAGAVRDAMQPEGLNVIQSNGAAATQTIDHLHVHILPRWSGDAVRDFWPSPNPTWSATDLDSMKSDLEVAMSTSSSAGYDMSSEQDREDRRKHLDLISAAIGRMAGSSAAAKGWSVTLAGAAFGVALVRDSWPFIALGILVLLAFGGLDSRYLNNERRARRVYDSVADDNSVVPLSLKGLATESAASHWWWPTQFRSWSIWLFYGPLALVGGGLLILALMAGPEAAPNDYDLSPPDANQQSK
ncbi:MAG: HIT domain-containing protein [Rhodococcus sp. (in: high G+C Gram-positive bacteria)]|uniref:HIT family protein n=1 Tax=Rhodococcus sp. TaxID=1831 RepID=UPI002AD754B7|nr:HIT domain-containing protein [Rhodococcus sp. (in: high G+C Gram-positive bacteria)]